jgi:DNA-binding HxlR family transcriptional regulator
MERRHLRAVEDSDGLASPGDRELMESTVAAVGLIAGKWRVEVLYLLAARVRRHGRLQDHLLVSKKVLSETLKSLERDGLVRRRVFADTPPRVEYSLTPLGRSLTGPLLALSEWADEHAGTVHAARADYDGARAHGASAAAAEAPRFTAEFQLRRESTRRLDAA